MSALITRHKTATIPVGLGITKKNLKPSNVPLTLGSRPAHLELMVAFVLELDAEQEYLSVSKSQFGLYVSEDPEPELLVHWDFERNPTHRYPQAHVQVNGDSRGFDNAIRLARSRLGKECPDRPLRDLHFPVGGRRFRPSLEDVIEFLILENLVDHRENWKDVIDDHRDAWEGRQLMAAVRRSPDTALRQLKDMGIVS
jgi:hypothetical protein